jgi:hypothetical protein
MISTRRTILKSIAAGASVGASRSISASPANSPQTPSAELKSNLDSLTATLRIGTEFFLNKTETKQGIDRHFRLMRDTGLTLVGTMSSILRGLGTSSVMTGFTMRPWLRELKS